jgi:hypothetical protein
LHTIKTFVLINALRVYECSRVPSDQIKTHLPKAIVFKLLNVTVFFEKVSSIA